MKFVVPDAVGIPLITPVSVSKVIPEGNTPLIIFQVMGAVSSSNDEVLNSNRTSLDDN